MVSKFRNPVPTVDVIILDNSQQNIVLIKRKYPPIGWALPGGFVDYGESLEAAALREAFEETNLELKLICQFQTYSNPSRDKRRHTISTVFIGILNTGKLCAKDDAADAQWFNLNELPKLVFDHGLILEDFKKYFLNESQYFIQSRNL